MAEPVAVTETTIRGFKKAIQDFLAPEIHDLKGDIGKLSTRIDDLDQKWTDRFHSMEKLMETQYRAIRDQQDVHFQAIMTAIERSEAKMELNAFKMISALSDRVSVLEGRQQ